MPSTTEAIDIMERSAPGWNREGEKGLLAIYDQAQSILMLQENAQFQAYRSDGKLPYITTTDEGYEYTLNQATTGLSVDIWRCAAILVQTPFSNQLFTILQNDYNSQPALQQPTRPLLFNGKEYFAFHQINCIDAVRDSHPILRFNENPGATTTDFYLLCYKKPTPITSENIEASMPEHLILELLIPCAMKLLEAYQTHNWIEAVRMIRQEFKPQIQEELNMGAQGDTNTITRYEE